MVDAKKTRFRVGRQRRRQAAKRQADNIEAPPLTCYKRSMDKTIRKYANFDEMKADEYRYWQSRPAHERVAAVWELTEEGYKLKGFKPDAFRLRRTLVHFERAPR